MKSWATESRTRPADFNPRPERLLALRHTRWTRVLGRWTDLLDAFAEHNAGSFSPLAWSIVFSAWLMRGARGPWVRRDELEADFMASQVVGRDSLLSALRKAHEQAAGLEVMMTVVATRSREVHVAPRSWTEAAYRAFEGLEAGDRRALRNAFREDPFDVDGRTHPPFAQRSSALIGLPRSGPGDTRRVLALLPDVLREEAALTARELRCARVVSSREWADAVHPKAVARDRYEGVAAATAFQEIEFLD